MNERSTAASGPEANCDEEVSTFGLQNHFGNGAFVFGQWGQCFAIVYASALPLFMNERSLIFVKLSEPTPLQFGAAQRPAHYLQFD